MGVYADLRVQDYVQPKSILDFWLQEKAAGVDPAQPAAYNAEDEVQTIAQYLVDPTGGTFALTLDIDGRVIVTAGIAYDAIASVIEGAIDTAATGVIPGWTNGDIAAAGGTLLVAGAPVTLTFGGGSVAKSSYPLTVFDGALLTGGTVADPAVSRTTTGQPARFAWAVLDAQGLVTTPLPANNADRRDIVITAGPNNPTNLNIRNDVLNELFRACADEDGNNSTYFGLSDHFWTFGADTNTAPNVSRYGEKTDIPQSG